MKKLLLIKTNNKKHWVGDGFPVQTIFTYNNTPNISPFLMLDYAEPMEFSPTETRRGVGPHPHRGFETVTLVYSGQVEHRDSHGGGGTIEAGDVQWMTAASGLVHEEFHGPNFSEQGGVFEVVQLWVNLPAEHKSHPPRYQGIMKERIPNVTLPADGGMIRVIAGEYAGKTGPAQTMTPINLWDGKLNKNTDFDLQVPEGHSMLLFLLSGQLQINKTSDNKTMAPSELAVFSSEGSAISIHADEPSKFLLLSGEPINEPIAGYGPFVMNTAQEIQQAIEDFNAGKMGTLSTS